MHHDSRASLRAKSALIVVVLLPLVLGSGSSCHEVTGATADIHERWYQPQSGWSYARPGILGDVVFFGTGDGRIIARRQATGAPVWNSKIAAEMIGGANMVVRNGTLVVPVVHETVALDVADGHELWRYSAPPDTTGFGPGTTAPGVVDQTHLASDGASVFIPAWGASVSAVDLTTGALRWVWRATPVPSDTAVRGIFRSGSMGVAVSGDTVYATAWHFRSATGADAEAWLVALDRLSGRVLWQQTMPWYGSGAFVWGAPVVSGNMVIFETGEGHEFALDRFTKALVWQYVPHTLNATRSSTEIFDGIVYHDGADGYIYGLRVSDGAAVYRGTSTVYASGAITARDMLVTSRRIIYSNGGTLHVLDRASGREIVSVQQPRTADPLISSPAAYANGQIFVTVGDAAWSFDEP